MTAEQIAKKYVHGLHDALTDRQEIKDMMTDIETYAESYHQAKLKLLGIGGVVGQSEQLPKHCHTKMEREKFNIIEGFVRNTLDEETLKANPQLIGHIIRERLSRLSFEELERLFIIELKQDESVIKITILGKDTDSPKTGDTKYFFGRYEL